MSYVLLELSAVETSYVTCVVVSGNVSTTPHSSALFAVLEKLIAVPVVFVVSQGIEYPPLPPRVSCNKPSPSAPALPHPKFPHSQSPPRWPHSSTHSPA